MTTAGRFSLTAVLLFLFFSSSVCLDIVKAEQEQLLTIAVALPGRSTNTSIVETSRLNIGNVTSPEVNVLWAHINQRDPFQMSRIIEEFDSRGVDLLIFPNDKYTVVKKTLHLESKLSSSILLYEQPESCEPEAQRIQSSNYSDDYLPVAAPDPDETGAENTARVDEVDALAMVIYKLDWAELFILHEESHEMAASALSNKLSAEQSHTRLLLYNLGGVLQGRSLYDLLETLYNEQHDELRVVLMCSVQCVKQVLTAASTFDALNSGRTAMDILSRWLLVLPPSEDQALDSYDLGLDNVAAIVYCPNVVTFKDIQQEMEGVLQKAYSDLLDLNQTASARTLSDSMRQIFQVRSENYQIVVKTLLWKPEGRRLSEVGYVGSDGHLRMEEGQDVFPNIKFGLNNRTFLVGTLEWPFFVEKTGNGTYRGLCADLLKQLQTMLNFSYVWTEPEDHEWGTPTANKTWTGLIGLLDRREVDLVVAPLMITVNRSAVVDFTYPYFIDYTTVLLKLPDPDDGKWRTLIRPFKANVHLCIWGSLLFMMFCTPALEYLNPYYRRHTTKSSLSVVEMFWFLLGALLNHGASRTPPSQTGRTMAAVFWIFSFLITASYSGNLVAFLAVSRAELPFTTLQGMVDQDLYKWGIPDGTVWVSVLKSQSASDVFQKIWAGIERDRGSDPDILSMDPDVHLAKVKAGGYAFIGDKSIFDSWLKTECDLVTIKEEFLPMQYAVALVNNSAYSRMFTEQLIKIDESGLSEVWKRRWWNKASTCSGSLITEAAAINLIDVQSAFYLIVIGFFLAFLILTLENLANHCHLAASVRSLFCPQDNQSEDEERSRSREPDAGSPDVMVMGATNFGFQDGDFGSATMPTAGGSLGSEFNR